MVKIFIILLCAALVPTFAQSAELKIGFVAPLSGGETTEGKIQINALKLAIKEINESGGISGKKISLHIEDNESSNPGSVNAFQKLATDPETAAIFAPVKTPQVIAMLPAIQKAMIPVFTGATNSRIAIDGKGWIFRGRVNDVLQGFAVISFVKNELKFSKIAILNDADSFGNGGGNMIERAAKDLGMTVVKRESFKPETTDFKPYFDSFAASGAQAMAVFSNKWKTLGLLQTQLKESKSKLVYVGSSTSVQKTTLSVAKAFAEGVYAVSDVAPGETEANRKFEQGYKKEYGEEPDFSQSWTYDLMKVAAEAMKKSGTDRAKIREAILAIKNHEGMLGTLSFDANGEGLHQAPIVRVEAGGKLKLVKVINGPTAL